MASDIIQAIRDAGAFDSEQEASEAAEATLTELAHCITEGEAEDLAAELPTDLAIALRRTEPTASAPVPYRKFRESLADRLDVDPETAESRADAVVSGLTEELPEETANAEAQLPPEYDRLFE